MFGKWKRNQTQKYAGGGGWRWTRILRRGAAKSRWRGLRGPKNRMSGQKVVARKGGEPSTCERHVARVDGGKDSDVFLGRWRGFTGRQRNRGHRGLAGHEPLGGLVLAEEGHRVSRNQII